MSKAELARKAGLRLGDSLEYGLHLGAHFGWELVVFSREVGSSSDGWFASEGGWPR